MSLLNSELTLSRKEDGILIKSDYCNKEYCPKAENKVDRRRFK